MTDAQLLLCRKQGKLFELSNTLVCGSSQFVKLAMNSYIINKLDNEDNFFDCSTSSSLLSDLVDAYPSLTTLMGNKYPTHIMYWIGYTYRAWSLITKKSSKIIYKECGFNTMVSLYETYHTFDIEYCVARLEELVSNNKPTDYQIYRKIRLSQSQR